MSKTKLEDTGLYQQLVHDMTEGHLSGRGAMHAGDIGWHKEKYRDPLAKKIAAAIVLQLGDSAAKLDDEQIRNVENGLALKLSEFSSREATAEAFGWKESFTGGHATPEPNQISAASFASEVKSMSTPLYQELYREMTTGAMSGVGNAMHGGSDGKHAAEYRNPLAKKVAMKVLEQFDHPEELTTEQIALVNDTFKEKMQKYGSRKAFAKEFGWQEGMVSGHYAEELEKQQAFAKSIADSAKEKIRVHEAQANQAEEARLELEQQGEVKRRELDRAATKIQSVARGNLVRQQTKQMLAKRAQEKQDLQNMTMAATQMQRLRRSVLQEKSARDKALRVVAEKSKDREEAVAQLRVQVEADICKALQIPLESKSRTAKEQSVIEAGVAAFVASAEEARTSAIIKRFDNTPPAILSTEHTQQKEAVAEAQQKFQSATYEVMAEKKAAELAAEESRSAERSGVASTELVGRSDIAGEQEKWHAEMKRLEGEARRKAEAEVTLRLEKERSAQLRRQKEDAPVLSSALEGQALADQSQKIVAEKRVALARKEAEQKQREEAAKKAVSDSNEKLYTTLYESMTKGDLSKKDQPMHGGRATLPFGKGSHEDRNPLAADIASKVAERYRGKLLSESDIDGIKKGVSLKLSEFKTREDVAAAYGWKEVHDSGRQKELEASGGDKYHEALEGTKRDNFVSEVQLMSEPLYQSVYAEVLKVTSKDQAADQAKAEARRVAIDITMGLDKAEITPERKAAVLETVGSRLENYQGSAKVLGGQVLDDLGHAPQFAGTELAEEAKRADQSKARAQEAQNRAFEEQRQREAEASATIGKSMQGMRARMELGKERLAEQKRKREEKERLEAEELQAFIKRTRDLVYEKAGISSRPGTKVEEAYIDAFVKKRVAQRNYNAAKDSADQYKKTNTPVPQSLQERLATLEAELNKANSSKAWKNVLEERRQRRREVSAMMSEEGKVRDAHVKDYDAATGDMFAEFQRVTKKLEEEQKKKLNRPWLRSLNHHLWFQRQSNSHNNQII